MNFLSNDLIEIGILSLGAELRSVINKTSDKQYIWQADASVWNRSSPVLFPFVGRLKNDEYHHQGKTYHLSQHGFARHCNFELIVQTQNQLTFLLVSDEESKKVYPFDFELILSYTLYGNELFLDYQVKNIGAHDMYFSIGAHPAFNTLGDLEDYSLVFEKPEAIERQIISSGLRNNTRERVELTNNTLRLEKRLFEVDAIVAEGLHSNEITLVNKENEKVVSVRVQDFPYYGIWSKSPYPFICLEPWVGIADKEDATGELSEKEGIQRLESMEIFLRRIAFRFF